MAFAGKTYTVLSYGLFTLVFPLFRLYAQTTGKHTKELNQRFGSYPQKLINQIKGSPRIWIHAASVGEVGAALPVIHSILNKIPDAAIIISTTTYHGQAFAQKKLGSIATCIYAPLDFIGSVRKALTTIQPHIMVFLETEIWPNWLFQAAHLGIKTAFINGRISARSMTNYRKIRPLIRQSLKRVSAFSMINRADADRIKEIGAPPQKVLINGNAKFDVFSPQKNPGVKTKMFTLFNLHKNQPVFVAGSTRTGEEEIILNVYLNIIKQFPETVLIIAPRHIQRARLIKKMVIQKHLSCTLRTELTSMEHTENGSVIILDTIGELQDAYSIANIVFCGGSLVPLGGQNILEPAAWGRPVIYGPSMEDFSEAKQLLEAAGAGIQVKNTRELTENIITLLKDPQKAKTTGNNAQRAIISKTGAAARHAAVIFQVLGMCKK